MVVISSVIAVISGVSLYEYYSARNWQQVTSQTRNDVVFEHRNQKYGAYEIRKNYDKKLILIMLSFIFCIGGLYSSYLYFKAPANPFDKVTTDSGGILVIPPPIEKPEKPEPEKAKPEKPDPKPIVTPPTKAFLEPIIVNKIDTLSLKLLDKGDIAGLTTKKGVDTLVPITQTVFIKKDDSTPKAPMRFPSKEAEFPGGEVKRQEYLIDKTIFPEEGLNSEGGKCYLQFIVSSEGLISSVSVIKGVKNCESCDKEAIRVIKAMPKWKPAEMNNEPVASYFNLVINFIVED